MNEETPVFEDKTAEFMYKNELCEGCKRKSKNLGYVDSFCRECHDKFMLLQRFKRFLNRERR